MFAGKEMKRKKRKRNESFIFFTFVTFKCNTYIMNIKYSLRFRNIIVFRNTKPTKTTSTQTNKQTNEK